MIRAGPDTGWKSSERSIYRWRLGVASGVDDGVDEVLADAGQGLAVDEQI